jgi:Ca-activated chloride channel family protein
MKKIELYIYVIFLIFLASCGKKDDGYSNYESLTYNGSSSPYTDGIAPSGQDYSGENYIEYEENAFIETSENPISTFSVDVDGGSYANSRRFLEDGLKPPAEAVRIEEFINYFDYNYDEPSTGDPISLEGEVSQCPWTSGHKLIRVGIKGKTYMKSELPPSNIVFLIDVSGSMSSSNKLDLLKESLQLYVDELRSEDRVAIVTYSGSAGVVLESTPCSQSSTIKNAIESLGSGGGTAGAEGIITAYQIAENYYVEGGNNRIIIGSDGDFNVGPSSVDELIELIEEKRENGVFLTVLGVGTGNYNDAMMEQLADNGNGNYEYIDDIEQARKVFEEDFSTFYTVAKDVKVQIEFNPEKVKSYRLIGYENRVLNTEDFEDDTKDAGDIGSGKCVTALYEIEPTADSYTKVGPSFEIKFRYKNPDEDYSNELSLSVQDSEQSFVTSSESMRFAASCAGFGMLLIDSQYKGTTSYYDVKNWVQNASSYDQYGHKSDLMFLIDIASGL